MHTLFRCSDNQRECERITAQGKAMGEAFGSIKSGVNFYANFGGVGGALPSSQGSRPALGYKWRILLEFENYIIAVVVLYAHNMHWFAEIDKRCYRLHGENEWWPLKLNEYVWLEYRLAHSSNEHVRMCWDMLLVAAEWHHVTPTLLLRLIACMCRVYRESSMS